MLWQHKHKKLGCVKRKNKIEKFSCFTRQRVTVGLINSNEATTVASRMINGAGDTMCCCACYEQRDEGCRCGRSVLGYKLFFSFGNGFGGAG